MVPTGDISLNKLILAQEEDVNEDEVGYVCYLKNGMDLITTPRVMVKLRSLGVGELWVWKYNPQRDAYRWVEHET